MGQPLRGIPFSPQKKFSKSFPNIQGWEEWKNASSPCKAAAETGFKVQLSDMTLTRFIPAQVVGSLHPFFPGESGSQFSLWLNEVLRFSLGSVAP